MLPLALYFRPSFERSLKRLGPEQRRTPRFFYKQLRKPYHEAGIDRHLRVIIRREGEMGIAVLAGNHDHIQQFLAGA